MDDVSIRLRCLELSLGNYENPDVVLQAQKFYDFVTGVKQAEDQYTFHLGDKG